jgi:hypothetical protein
VVGAIIKHQIKDPNVADSAKYYYLLMLKHFVDSGNNELVQQYVPKHLMKRLGMIALHRKEEKNMERGMDCLSLFALDPEMEKKTSGYGRKTQ